MIYNAPTSFFNFLPGPRPGERGGPGGPPPSVPPTPGGGGGGGGGGSSPLPAPQVPGGLSRFYLNSTPDAAFWEYLRQSGLQGSGRAVDKYAQGQQSRVYNRYQAHIANEPNLGFFDYLERERPNLEQEFWDQSPQQRGDTSNRFLTPKARFVNAY